MPTFEIGLVMAGAVSAGAYSAGVMDFFIEALNAYEEARKSPSWRGPIHDVRLPIIAGASAGGMTAAIAGLQIFHEMEHIWPKRPAPDGKANRLYSSWVRDAHIDSLLQTADLEGDRQRGGLKSVLCSDVLERIVDRAFDLGPFRGSPGWIGRGSERKLRVLLTLSNLRGVPYSFPLFGAGSGERYGMLNHSDYLSFDIGTDTTSHPGAYALDIKRTEAPEWQLFRHAALATGAFPIGLAPRIIERQPADYLIESRVGFDRLGGRFEVVSPDTAFGKEVPYQFISVDGGMIDNEPFELARRYLSGAPDRHNDRSGDKADRAVVLVDPFPNRSELPAMSGSTGAVGTAMQLFSVLVDQARFKPAELATAADESVFSRFAIYPLRTRESLQAGNLQIACGGLGGFSGFLDRSFRRHDYLLGKRNAQAFLRWSFALPETNPLFEGFEPANREAWYVRDVSSATRTVSATAERTFSKKLFARRGPADERAAGLPIIPLTPRLCEPVELQPEDQPYPSSIGREELHSLLKRRIERVVDTLVDIDFYDETKDLPLGAIFRPAAKHWGTEVLSSRARALVDATIDEIAASFGS